MNTTATDGSAPFQGSRRPPVKVLALALGMALAAPCAVAADTDGGLGAQTSLYIRDYLSDNRRVGSLVGSILGGAATAHPAGPVVGSLIGFLIGKATMHEEDKGRPQLSAAQRSIIPPVSQAVAAPSLSFADPQGVSFDAPAPAAMPVRPAAPAVASAPAAQPAAPFAPAALTQQAVLPGLSREQLAAACSGGQLPTDPRLRSLCFYARGS